MRKMADMPYHFGIHMRLYPDDRQKQVIRANCDAARFVYNCCVAVGKELYLLRKVSIYLEPVAERIRFLQDEYRDVRQMSNIAPFLNADNIDVQAKHNAVQNYNKAWKQFREGNGSIPVFHKKSHIGSYQTNPHYGRDAHGLTDGTGVRFLDAEHIILPKIGRIRIKGDTARIRKLLSHTDDIRIGTVTVSIDPERNFHVSMQLGSEEPFAAPLPKTGATVGIDVNLENFCSDSNGGVIENPKYRRAGRTKLAKAQRKLSRMACGAKKKNTTL